MYRVAAAECSDEAAWGGGEQELTVAMDGEPLVHVGPSPFRHLPLHMPCANRSPELRGDDSRASFIQRQRRARMLCDDQTIKLEGD